MKTLLSAVKPTCLALLMTSTLAFAEATEVNSFSSTPVAVESDAMRAGNLIFISGQGGGDASNPDNTGAAIEESLKKIEMIAKQMGGDLSDVIKLDVYTNDLNRDFPLLNEMMLKYFKAPYPTRTTVGAAMIPKNHTVEIDAVMLLKDN
jgi:enamine deaminase RidA (YjgF/YER057c/UK114 family)